MTAVRYHTIKVFTTRPDTVFGVTVERTLSLTTFDQAGEILTTLHERGVGTVVTATSYLVPVVDFMLIGILLGADAVAAAGLGDSFVDIAELPGFVLSAGGPVAAGILLGRRKRRLADGAFTLSFLLALVGGLLAWCLLAISAAFCPTTARSRMMWRGTRSSHCSRPRSWA